MFKTPEEKKFFELLHSGKNQEAVNYAAKLVVSSEPKGVGLYHLERALERLDSKESPIKELFNTYKKIVNN